MRSSRRTPRLALIERVPLGPRQALFLVEAEGIHLLVATAADGTPAFYALPVKSGIKRCEQDLKSVRAFAPSRPGFVRKTGGRISW